MKSCIEKIEVGDRIQVAYRDSMSGPILVSRYISNKDLITKSYELLEKRMIGGSLAYLLGSVINSEYCFTSLKKSNKYDYPYFIYIEDDMIHGIIKKNF